MQLSFFQVYLIGCAIVLVLNKTVNKKTFTKSSEKTYSENQSIQQILSKQVWLNANLILFTILSWLSVLIIVFDPLYLSFKKQL